MKKGKKEEDLEKNKIIKQVYFSIQMNIKYKKSKQTDKRR